MTCSSRLKITSAIALKNKAVALDSCVSSPNVMSYFTQHETRGTGTTLLGAVKKI